MQVCVGEIVVSPSTLSKREPYFLYDKEIREERERERENKFGQNVRKQALPGHYNKE